ncbi:hypothetical protein JTE90_021642 [Oedothorax gibbosus]|uniref:Uncharacterized protein n=1 Tax=Oedothorax gibbosus TaxID=931172 RepID=A0AAV6VPH5_9ARAC|nr:hypothetical protein JTE90_021642 [Oedothorax gibbosus]
MPCGCTIIGERDAQDPLILSSATGDRRTRHLKSQRTHIFQGKKHDASKQNVVGSRSLLCSCQHDVPHWDSYNTFQLNCQHPTRGKYRDLHRNHSRANNRDTL